MATLRNKTRSKLSEEKCRILEEVVSNFLKENGEKAEDTIWQLCYQPEKVLMSMGFSDDISEEESIVIQSELASQYRTAHKDWNYGQYVQECSKGCTEAAKALKAALRGNRFAFDTVMQKLIECSYASEYKIEHTLRCLLSGVERSRFGGVRSLGFNYDESDYLKKVAKEMGDVLEEMTLEKMLEYRASEEESQNPEEEKFKDLPFFFGNEKTSKDLEDELEVKDSEESSKEENDRENSRDVETEEKGMVSETQEEAKKDLSPLELIEQREVIEAFFEAYKIVTQTQNAEWLIEHAEQIKGLYKQCDSFR